MEEGVPEAENLLRPKDNKEEQKEKQKDEEERGANVGILNHLISNLMGTTKSVEDENIQKLECEGGDKDEKKGESSGVGILEKIKSHLPEDAVPTTDEAAILIHSVID